MSEAEPVLPGVEADATMCRSRISHAGTGETVRTPACHSCAVCAVGAGVEVLAHAGEDRLDPRPR